MKEQQKQRVHGYGAFYTFEKQRKASVTEPLCSECGAVLHSGYCPICGIQREGNG